MTEVTAQQVVHGYADGHRLLASSFELPPSVSRLLLVHSDAQVGPGGLRSISSLALPDFGLWALTATWPAPEVERAGSVWSHTLLLDSVALDDLRGAGGLLLAFRNPGPDHDLDSYRLPLSVQDETIELPSELRAVAERCLLGMYGWPGRRIGVLTDDLTDADLALLALWEQQWPRLRATTSFAIRPRLSDAEGPTLQIALGRGRVDPTALIELHKEGSPVIRRPRWLDTLLTDLEQPGSIRKFLRRYGSDAPRGRADMATLVRFSGANRDLTVSGGLFAALADAYPEPQEMDRLKHDFLALDSSVWQVPEPVRLHNAIDFIDTINWEQLGLPSRLAAMWPAHAEELVPLVSKIWTGGQPKRLLKALVNALAEIADARMIEELAGINVDLTARIAVKRQSLLEASQLWKQGRTWQRALLNALQEQRRRCDPGLLANTLVQAGRDDLLTEALHIGLVRTADVASAVASEGATGRSLMRWEAVLGDELTAAANAAATSSATWDERLLASAIASAGRSTLLMEFGQDLAQHLHQADEQVRLRVAAALLAYGLHGSKDFRRLVVCEAFPQLHRAAVNRQLPEPVRSELKAALPDPQQRDLAKRLRQAAVNIIREDEWNTQEVASLISRSGPGADKIRTLAKKRSDLRKLLDSAWELATFRE